MTVVGDKSVTDSVGDIFKAMTYDPHAQVDFSTILTWLASRNNVLTSIVDGEWTTSGGSKDDQVEFVVGGTKAWLERGGATLVKSLLNGLPANEATTESQEADKGLRLQKLRDLVGKASGDLCLLESVATGIPVWQIREFDQPTWTNEIRPQAGNSKVGNELVLVDLLESSDCFAKLLSGVLSGAAEWDGRLVLAVNVQPGNSSLLPLIYLVQAIKNAGIRKTPIHLLLLDLHSQEMSAVLKEAAAKCRISVWGDVHPAILNKCPYPPHLISGVLSPYDGVTGRGAHFIVDSSADIETAVESISANVWSSGTQMISRARSLLFVHQPIYKDVIASLEGRQRSLHVAADVAAKSADFILRPQVNLDVDKILKQGAKVSSATLEGGLRGPTLVYNIGTSADLVTSPRAGTGHILVVIPYRSNAELLGLTNNFDLHNQVFLFATNLDFLRQTASAIKAKDVWVNTSRGTAEVPPCYSRSKLSVLRETNTGQETRRLLADGSLLKAVEGAEKSLKSWAATSVPRRLELLEKVIDLVGGDAGVNGSQKPGSFLNPLVKIAGRISAMDAGGNLSGGKLKLENFLPAGLVGLVLVNPVSFCAPSKVMPLLLSALKGNATVLISLSTSPSAVGVSAALEKACASILPPGVVSFVHLNSSTLSNLISWAAKLSKFNLLWVIQKDNLENISPDFIPVNAFNRVIIDTVSDSGEPLLERSEFLESSQTIHL